MKKRIGLLIIVFCIVLISFVSADPTCSFINITQGPPGVNGTTPVFGVDYFNGTNGAAGADGTSCTIAAGTATVGTPLSVSNVGNATTGVFDFVIPPGAKGDKGDKGDAGVIPDIAEFLFRNGTRAMTGNLSMANYYINNLFSGSESTDAVNKSYVDSKSTYNSTYDTTSTTVANNLNNWNATYNSTYDSKPSSTYNATYDAKPSSTYNTTYDATSTKVTDNLAAWNATYNATYDALVGGSTYNSTYDATSTKVTDNLAAWNATYNSTYDAKPSSTYNATYDTTSTTVTNNLANWNATYNASYLTSTYNATYDAKLQNPLFGYVTLMAGSAMVTTTNPSTMTQLETSNGINYIALNFTTNGAEIAQWLVDFPADWNSTGNVIFTPVWTAREGTPAETCNWTIKARLFADDAAFDTAVAQIGTSNDTLLATTDIHVAPPTTGAAITGAGNTAIIQISRDASDTMAGTAQLIGLRVKYVTNKA